ncbi:MAG: UvrD-helicase domain-containing protein [Tissierellia bacterium]|nr:UvrD-helicase domain-containing protein [Tissierellia bacterium]
MEKYGRLNEQQLKALHCTDGPLLILAGAGSGKTRVITHKIAWLIENNNVHPAEILAITFTNKAATEMKERVSDLLNRPVSHMWLGTFHSMAVRILRRDIDLLDYDRNFSIYDRDNQITVVKECMKELEISTTQFKPSGILSKISTIKSSESYFNKSDSFEDYYEQQVIKVFNLYEQKLQKYQALDFDDLIVKAVILLDKYKEVRDRYQEQFKYVFVDEYQDTNYMQYKMVKLLSGKYKNICVVGDGDQSIYGWRGADIRNILDFERDFPNGNTILLEQNYRSSGKILKAANQVIGYNTERKDKNLWSSKPDGEPVEYWLYNSGYEEAMMISERIQGLVSQGRSLEEIVILYRTNAQSRQFEESFMRLGIPYRIVGGIRFYERKEIKDFIGYLTFVVNPSDEQALKRIINTPKRGIGAVTEGKILETARQSKNLFEGLKIFIQTKGGSLKVNTGLTQLINAVEYGINNIREDSLTELVKVIMEKCGLIQELESERTVESRTRLENLEEFINVAAQFEEEFPEATLYDFIGMISLLSDEDKTVEGDRKITLMTLHSAKGLEFPVVFMAGLEEGLFPSKMADNENRIEEERRLCYVGITRAEELLVLSGARSRMLYGSNQYTLPSRFLEELGTTIDFMNEPSYYRESLNTNKISKTHQNYKPVKAPIKNIVVEKYNVGDRVVHETLGEGMIVSIKEKSDDSIITISFDKSEGIKKFLASGTPLTKV